MSGKCATHWNSAWLKNCTLRDLAWLTRPDELMNNVYVLDNMESAARHPVSKELPWHVLLLLGSFSKKHVFLKKTLPEWKRVRQAGIDMVNKLRWRFHHRDSDQAMPQTLGLSKSTAPCKHVKDPEFNWVEMRVKNWLSESYGCAELHKSKLQSRPHFVTAAINWIKDNNMVACVSDKDGVFCLLDISLRDELLNAQLSKGWYVKMFRSQYESALPRLRSEGRSLCNDLKKFVEPKTVSDIVSCLYNHNHSGASSVATTVKTHKAAGDVQLRLVHASHRHMLNGFSKWIEKVLMPIVRKIACVASSSRDVIKSLARSQIGARTALSKLDVKDFYMDGSHNDSEQNCTDAVRDYLAEGGELPMMIPGEPFRLDTFRYILRFVLINQFVDNNECDVVYRTVKGSGMGMAHSSAVSTINFWIRVEKSLCSRSSNLGIQLYLRYHDDILIATENPSAGKAVINMIKDSAAPMYRISVDEVSMQGVPMLDIYVFKNRGSSRLHWQPYIKPTARHVPLSDLSVHNSTIHKSWPVSEIRRMHKLSELESTFKEFKRAKIERFQKFFMRSDIIDSCENWNPPVPCISFCRSEQLTRGRDSNIARIILPFHPSLAKGANASRAFLNLDIRKLLGPIWNKASDLSIQIAWSNCYKNLSSLLREIDVTSTSSN